MRFDDLESRFLRELAYVVAKALSILLKKSQRSGKFPSNWKKENITLTS